MRKPEYTLRSLFWEATLRCNAYCEFCGSRCGDVETEELSTEEIENAFTRIAGRYPPGSVMIHVTGGEPLLRRDLFQVMEHCRRLGFSWGMVTNASLLTETVARQMKETGMKTISISLDGLPDTHDRLRRMPGGYQKVMDAIGILRKEAFLDHLQVTTVVSRRNLDELERLFPILEAAGIDSWRLAMVDPIGRARDNQDLLLGKEEIRRLLDFIRLHDGGSLRLVTSCSHYLGGREGLDHGVRPWTFICQTGLQVASILANGDIFVCPNVERRPEWIQGNVRTDDFCQVWEEGFGFFRSWDRCRAERCESCPEWPGCRGDSMHTWDPDRREPRFCYREIFGPGQNPVSTSHSPDSFDTLIERLKQDIPRLTGIHIQAAPAGFRTLVFTPEAARDLHACFRWGESHPYNLDELMAALFGRTLRQGEDGEIREIVEFVCPIHLIKRSATEAIFSEETYRDTLRELDRINRNYGLADEKYRLWDSPCRLLGYVHSHPREMAVSMSSEDIRLHRGLSSQAGSDVTVILNPQRPAMAAYGGEKCVEMDILLLADEADLPEWKSPLEAQ